MISRRHLIATLPSAFVATTLTAPSAAGEIACDVSVSRLRQGELVDTDDVEFCRSYQGSSPVFQVASLSKPVVATIVLRQVLRGQLGLDQPVSELLPKGYAHQQNLFSLREPPRVDQVPIDVLRTLTIRHLLSHTSGLPNWSDRAPLLPLTVPGTRWRYSGEGYVLLQQILLERTGKPLHELASSEIFEPLGMRHSAFKIIDRIAPNLVPGRTNSGEVRQMRFPYEIAASSLYTSATDFARFMAATLDDESLLRLITQAPVKVPDADGVVWGLGWAIEQSGDGPFIWHWGSNPGFRALAMANLKSKNGVVILTSTEAGMPRAKQILRRFLPGAHPGLDLRHVN